MNGSNSQFLNFLQHADVKQGPTVGKQPLTWDEFTVSWGTLKAVGPLRCISSGLCAAPEIGEPDHHLWALSIPPQLPRFA